MDTLPASGCLCEQWQRCTGKVVQPSGYSSKSHAYMPGSRLNGTFGPPFASRVTWRHSYEQVSWTHGWTNSNRKRSICRRNGTLARKRNQDFRARPADRSRQLQSKPSELRPARFRQECRHVNDASSRTRRNGCAVRGNRQSANRQAKS